MTPYEDLLKAIGLKIGETLKSENHSCRLDFGEGVAVQIDLESSGDKILLGSRLGALSSGSYLEKMLLEALKMNGRLQLPNGILAFSEKNDELVLFYHFPLIGLDVEKLYPFLLKFVDHARVWVNCIKEGSIPEIEEESVPDKSGFMGMR